MDDIEQDFIKKQALVDRRKNRRRDPMKKYEIQVIADNCPGCLRCALACSDTYTRAFNAPVAYIRVDISDIACSIHFTDDCNACGICADNCLYDALQKQAKEAVE